MMQQSQLAVAEKRAAEDRANAAGAAAATAAAASATAAAALSAERKARIRMMQQSQLGSLQGSSGEARASPTSDRVNADASADVIAPRGAGDLVGELGMDVSPTQITDSLPAVPSFDVLRKRRFVSDEPYLRRRPEDTLAHAELARLGSGLPGDDPGTGMGAKQKNEHEELTDDLFDDSPHTYARLFKRNLATTSVVLLIISLLVYTCMDPVATDFVWKLSLSSPLNERLAFRDPKHKLHIVNSEAMAVRGTWWRLESLEGSAKPSVYHNQWDLAGVQFFSDYACEIPVTQSSKGVDGSLAKETVSALLTSESTHHEWHQTRPGWGFLEANGGAYINEPQSGGSRVSVHITGQDAITMPRCVAFASCAGEPAVAVPSAGEQQQQQQRQPGRRLLKKKKLPPVKAERKREKVKAEVTAIDLGVAAATADAMESLPALYNGETEAACAPEHFPASMQLAVFDAAADSWTEVLRFNESEMLEVTGGVAGSLRTMLVPEEKRQLAAEAAKGMKTPIPQTSQDDVAVEDVDDTVDVEVDDGGKMGVSAAVNGEVDATNPLDDDDGGSNATVVVDGGADASAAATSEDDASTAVDGDSDDAGTVVQGKVDASNTVAVEDVGNVGGNGDGGGDDGGKVDASAAAASEADASNPFGSGDDAGTVQGKVGADITVERHRA
mmetsp:Transcript_38320/g.95216  ORF Transcript_38320/g.95216 Transcript_38320/m.95216 type:complete len:671 (-) Transcript_38320:94-2106(-)